MGGEGIRFNSSLPKQLHHIGGKPIFIHTLGQFLKMNCWSEIILPTPVKWIKEVQKEIASIPNNYLIRVIPGGATRQESSYLGLLACKSNTDYVVIHDGVRPFVTEEILQSNLDAVQVHKAVDTCISSADTLVHSKDGSSITTIPCRKELLRGQTPQSFSFQLILEAHKKALENCIENSSDDCSLVLALEHPVKIVSGNDLNIKITTELDLFLAEQILYRSFEESSPLSFTSSEDLTGKVFAVTGATGGIGQALCKKLIELGAIPIEISTSSLAFKTDLTKHEDTKKTFKDIHAKHGLIDGLINSIGTFEVKDFSSLSEQDIDKTIASNLTSVIYCCQSIQLKKGGHIVNISSSSYSRGRKDYPIYSASKAAVVNFTQGLAGVRPDLYVNVVVPQRTNTALRKANFPEEDTSSLLHPDEIAEKIAKLLKASSITGAILEVRKKHKKTSDSFDIS